MRTWVFWHSTVEEERPDDDTITTQCDATTVHEGTNVNTENTATSEPTSEYSTNEDTNANTWVEVVKRRTKKTNERKQIVSSIHSRNNPVN